MRLEDYASLLACPVCGEALEVAGTSPDEGLICRCGARCPTVGGIPCLFGEPHAVVREWRFALGDFVAAVDDERARVLADLGGAASVLDATRARVERYHRALGRYAELIVAAFEEIGLPPARRSEPGGDVGLANGVVSYYHQIHRDWGWPQEEIEAALAVITRVAGKRPLGKTLVLGAGACRLVREMHLRLGGTVTVAVDLNPLPMLVAKKALAGGVVTLAELPASPRSAGEVGVERPLGQGLSPVPGVVLVFADALAPPFARGAFDTVVTPWFLDQVVPDVPPFARALRDLLAPGGAWLNHGPFVYPKNRSIVLRHPPDELCTVVESAGFRIAASGHERLTFMQSPICNQGRTEHVLTFLAEQAAGGAPREAPRPGWLDDTSAPVPRFEGLEGYTAPHPFFGALVALIDGRRSVADIAAIVAGSQGMPEDAVRVAARAALEQIVASVAIQRGRTG
jgi:uncharacterized protein YbaR (Trm112 family)